MVVISAGVLISDCCQAIAACANDDCSAYQCTQCSKLCTASESLGQYRDRLEAPRRERERLEREVIEAAKALDRRFTWTGDFTSVDSARAYDAFKRTMRELNKYDAEHGAGG